LSHRNEKPPFLSWITVKGEFTMAHSLIQIANYFVHQLHDEGREPFIFNILS